MHLLYTDEVNVNPDDSEFFVYAGVAVPGDNAAALSAAIEALRTECGYRPEDLLKFNTRERAEHITVENHRNAKERLMQVGAEHGVKLFASFLLHRIAQNTGVDEARRREINRICYNFDCYLNRVNDKGLVLIDTFPDATLNSVLREKFSVGVTGLPFSPRYRLERILGFHLASIGTSHFTSVIDVVLGGLRFAVNNRQDERKRAVVATIVAQLRPLFLMEQYASGPKASEISLFFSPKNIRHRPYYDQYQDLSAFFQANGITPAQQLTNDR